MWVRWRSRKWLYSTMASAYSSFSKERLSSLHDDVGVVVLFDRIAQENLLVGAAEGFLRRYPDSWVYWSRRW